MNKNDIKVGMMVDYHSIIGGAITESRCEVISAPWQLGHGQWVVRINRITGGVSLDAITAVHDAEG